MVGYTNTIITKRLQGTTRKAACVRARVCPLVLRLLMVCFSLVCSRGNTDAVNVHPVEFVLGEYNHLLAVYLYNRCFPIHPLSCLLFMIAGGLMTGFNHTRHDMVFEMFGIKLFDTKAHDVHHRIPQSNYGQYTMLWDYFLGSYR